MPPYIHAFTCTHAHMCIRTNHDTYIFVYIHTHIPGAGVEVREEYGTAKKKKINIQILFIQIFKSFECMYTFPYVHIYIHFRRVRHCYKNIC